MSDLISRQAAIDALCDDYCSGHHDCKRYPKCENLRAIQKLPSAQSDKTYEQGWKDGREALRKEIWEYGRDRLN